MGITVYRNFEEEVNAAQKSIGRYYSYYARTLRLTYEEEKKWLQKLLDILKEKKYATIQANNGKLVDVTAIAGTYNFASFFDVINHINMFNLKIDPVITEERKNSYYNAYDAYESQNN